VLTVDRLAPRRLRSVKDTIGCPSLLVTPRTCIDQQPVAVYNTPPPPASGWLGIVSWTAQGRGTIFYIAHRLVLLTRDHSVASRPPFIALWNEPYIPVFSPQQQSFTALWLMSSPAESRRLSWPLWLATYRGDAEVDMGWVASIHGLGRVGLGRNFGNCHGLRSMAV